jgi:hypothetical protein
MWSGRTIAAASAATLVAGCAGMPLKDSQVETRVASVLERRGLGPDALLVVDNLLRHGPPPPPATPPLVLELLARPLAAVDASRIFGEAVPRSLVALQASPSNAPFEDLLSAYLGDLAEAQRMLRSATRTFDDEPLLRELAAGLPSSALLLAAADAIDTAQLERANRLFIDATARFASQLRDSPIEPRTFESAIGTVVIGTRGNDRHGPQAALIIDPGGDDAYERAPARDGAVSVIVDLGGNDEYRGSDLALRGLSAIVDLAGDDRYEMETGLAAAIAGTALLVDYSGNDRYEAKFFAQGAAAFGVGALLDLGGDDRYRVEAWGQGFGIASGVGLLWDRAGGDRYAAGGVPDPFGRGSGLSGAQGAGFGARNRLGGGTGILRDDGGDDLYEAQMFAQGSGYYYGLGVLWDRGGADRYQAFRYAQGNAAHQAIGVLRDEAGDDRYAIADIYGQGMGLDVALGVLVDAAGDDIYSAHAVAQGAATANGFGLLADENGARFELAAAEHGWGRAEWLRGLPSVGVLLHGNSAQFTRAGQMVPTPPDNPPVAVQPASAETCPSSDPGEALLCRVRDASDLDAAWRELALVLEEDPSTPLAGWIAIALGKRPPANADEIAALLARRESCNVRALALRAWPTLPAAHEGLRTSCWRLQAAARAAFVRLGVPLPEDARLPSFLRTIPPQEDTF